jgi:hypothetical protein
MVKVSKFRIKNYKSIIDTGDCYLEESITILVGKNESGKTSILEALEDFDTGRKIREAAKPIKSPEAMPEISVTFDIPEPIVKSVLDEVDGEKTGIKSISLEIVKTFPDNYHFEESSYQKSGLSRTHEINSIKKQIQASWKDLQMIHRAFPQIGSLPAEFSFSDLAGELKLFSTYRNAAAANNVGIASVDKTNNVIVEGPSDVFYLNAFKLLTKGTGANFIFGGGIGNMPIVGTILHGWGCKVLYLYNNDQGKKDGSKNLTRNWLVAPELILAVLGTPGSVEDLFTPSDFCKQVLGDENRKYTESNSEFVKKAKLDKVLLAKKFLEKVQNSKLVHLEQETLKRIKALFDEINSRS